MHKHHLFHETVTRPPLPKNIQSMCFSNKYIAYVSYSKQSGRIERCAEMFGTKKKMRKLCEQTNVALCDRLIVCFQTLRHISCYRFLWIVQATIKMWYFCRKNTQKEQSALQLYELISFNICPLVDSCDIYSAHSIWCAFINLEAAITIGVWNRTKLK